MNVLMILTNPFTNDPRVYNEARSLINAGYNVTVFAWDKKKLNPEDEFIDGIKVHRNFNSKFMDFLHYDLLRLHFWWIKGYKDAIKFCKKKNFDIIHCHDLDALVIGVKLKKKLDLPLIYDSHELFAYGMSRNVPFWKYYLKKEKRIIKNVDRIITVNEPLKQFFKMISDIPVTIIMNAKPLQNREYIKPKNDIFTLVYAGTIAKPRFLLELVDVVNLIEEVYCIIAGIGFDKEYISDLKKKCLQTDRINFVGKVSMEKVLQLTKKADVIVCMTDPKDPNNSRATANKQFEAMVCGRPIICTKNTYPGLLTEKEKVGVTAEYTKEDLKKVILELKHNPKLCQDLGKAALNTAINKYNWEIEEKKLLKIYKGIK